MNIIELIFSNPLLIIIILGLINFLVGQNKKGKTENKPNNEQQREHIPREKHFEKEFKEHTQTQDHFEPKPFVKIETKIDEQPLSIEELRQQQLERLSMDFRSNITDDEEVNQDEQLIMEKVQVDTKNEGKRKRESYNLTDRVTKKGLMESVIMSEVLGPPRARKRYNNNRF